MTLAYAEEAIHVHDTGHLSDRDIARATGRSGEHRARMVGTSQCP